MLMRSGLFGGEPGKQAQTESKKKALMHSERQRGKQQTGIRRRDSRDFGEGNAFAH